MFSKKPFRYKNPIKELYIQPISNGEWEVGERNLFSQHMEFKYISNEEIRKTFIYVQPYVRHLVFRLFIALDALTKERRFWAVTPSNIRTRKIFSGTTTRKWQPTLFFNTERVLPNGVTTGDILGNGLFSWSSDPKHTSKGLKMILTGWGKSTFCWDFWKSKKTGNTKIISAIKKSLKKGKLFENN